jgi:hypothetical protein
MLIDEGNRDEGFNGKDEHARVSSLMNKNNDIGQRVPPARPGTNGLISDGGDELFS